MSESLSESVSECHEVTWRHGGDTGIPVGYHHCAFYVFIQTTSYFTDLLCSYHFLSRSLWRVCLRGRVQVKVSSASSYQLLVVIKTTFR